MSDYLKNLTARAKRSDDLVQPNAGQRFGRGQRLAGASIADPLQGLAAPSPSLPASRLLVESGRDDSRNSLLLGHLVHPDADWVSAPASRQQSGWDSALELDWMEQHTLVEPTPRTERPRERSSAKPTTPSSTEDDDPSDRRGEESAPAQRKHALPTPAPGTNPTDSVTSVPKSMSPSTLDPQRPSTSDSGTTGTLRSSPSKATVDATQVADPPTAPPQQANADLPEPSGQSRDGITTETPAPSLSAINPQSASNASMEEWRETVSEDTAPTPDRQEPSRTATPPIPSSTPAIPHSPEAPNTTLGSATTDSNPVPPSEINRPTQLASNPSRASTPTANLPQVRIDHTRPQSSSDSHGRTRPAVTAAQTPTTATVGRTEGPSGDPPPVRRPRDESARPFEQSVEVESIADPSRRFESQRQAGPTRTEPLQDANGDSHSAVTPRETSPTPESPPNASRSKTLRAGALRQPSPDVRPSPASDADNATPSTPELETHAFTESSPTRRQAGSPSAEADRSPTTHPEPRPMDGAPADSEPRAILNTVSTSTQVTAEPRGERDARPSSARVTSPRRPPISNDAQPPTSTAPPSAAETPIDGPPTAKPTVRPSQTGGLETVVEVDAPRSTTIRTSPANGPDPNSGGNRSTDPRTANAARAAGASRPAQPSSSPVLHRNIETTFEVDGAPGRFPNTPPVEPTTPQHQDAMRPAPSSSTASTTTPEPPSLPLPTPQPEPGPELPRGIETTVEVDGAPDRTPNTPPVEPTTPQHQDAMRPAPSSSTASTTTPEPPSLPLLTPQPEPGPELPRGIETTVEVNAAPAQPIGGPAPDAARSSAPPAASISPPRPSPATAPVQFKMDAQMLSVSQSIPLPAASPRAEVMPPVDLGSPVSEAGIVNDPSTASEGSWDGPPISTVPGPRFAADDNDPAVPAERHTLVESSAPTGPKEGLFDGNQTGDAPPLGHPSRVHTARSGPPLGWAKEDSPSIVTHPTRPPEPPTPDTDTLDAAASVPLVDEASNHAVPTDINVEPPSSPPLPNSSTSTPVTAPEPLAADRLNPSPIATVLDRIEPAPIMVESETNSTTHGTINISIGRVVIEWDDSPDQAERPRLPKGINIYKPVR